MTSLDWSFLAIALLGLGGIWLGISNYFLSIRVSNAEKRINQILEIMVKMSDTDAKLADSLHGLVGVTQKIAAVLRTEE